MSTIKYNFRDVEKAFVRVLCHSRALRADQWVFHLIVNPGAGGFNFEGFRQKLGGSMPRGVRILSETSEKAVEGLKPSTDEEDIDLRLHLSAYPDHAGLIAVSIANSIHHEQQRHMIISIGGDGTHNEIMNALHTGANQASLALCRVFRFPLGSGNDAADAWTPEEAWNLLISGAEQGPAGAVEVTTATGVKYHAYNITSIGIDAHIAKVTDQLKDKLPGDFYKLAADLSVPFYPDIYKIGNMKISGTAPDGETMDHEFRLGLLAFGVSGFRTYGHGLWILPDEENICAIELRNLMTNIKMKKELYRSKHSDLPFVSMFDSSDISIEYHGDIPMQLDGEVMFLKAEDFPLRMRIITTGVYMFSGKDLSLERGLSVKNRSNTEDGQSP